MTLTHTRPFSPPRRGLGALLAGAGASPVRNNGGALVDALILSAPSRSATQLTHQDKDESSSGRRLISSITKALAPLDDQYQRLVKRYVDPLLGANRLQQIDEMANENERVAVTGDEKGLNRNVGLSLLLTGAALAVGHAIVPTLLICLPLATYISIPPLRRAHRSIFHEHRLTMPVLASINMLGLWLGGFYAAGGFGLAIYFIAEKLIFITEDNSRQKLVNIFGQQPRFVWAVVDDVEVEIPFHQLQVGDTIVIGAGQLIPVDGVIRKGHASIDQHRLTGESQPAEMTVGDRVLAATVVLAGKIYIAVEKAGHETAAAQIGDILNSTASYQMAIDSQAIQVVNASIGPTLLASALAWWLVNFEGAVAITNSSFGFNMRLTGPIAMLNYLNIAARRGILVKDGRSLELLSTIDTVIFDKTGTLTLEQPRVVCIHSFNGVDEATLLAYAAAAEDRQTHPIARAIVTAAQEQGLRLPAIDDARYELGYGLKVWIDGHLIRVGSDRFMALEGIDRPPTLDALQSASHDEGHSLVMLAVDDALAGVIELQPTIRPEAHAIVQALHQHNITVYVISGDQEAPTEKLVKELGIDHYFANTLPEDKAKHVARLQAEGRNVCFIGDGINDSIALKKAQVSISLRGATTVATDTAQIVMMDATLQQLPYLFDLARGFDRNLKTGFTAAMLPGFLIIGGVFFGQMGVLGSLLVYNAGLFTGLGIAMLPLLRHRGE